MFHCVLNNNNLRISHKLRQILADFVMVQLDSQLPGLGMTIGELIWGSGLPKEGFPENIAQSSNRSGGIEFYMLASLFGHTFQV